MDNGLKSLFATKGLLDISDCELQNRLTVYYNSNKKYR